MPSRKQRLVEKGHKLGGGKKKSKNKNTSKGRRIFSVMRNSKEKVDSKRAGRREKKRSDFKAPRSIQLTALLGEEGIGVNRKYLIYRGSNFQYSIKGRRLTVHAGDLERDFYLGSLDFFGKLKGFLGGWDYDSETR
jgi:hypothetical protein